MATIKQQKAVKELVVNGGNVAEAMRKAEYSENTINTPQKLTESKGFIELWDEVIPQELLVKVHKEGLEANKIISANITYGDADEKTNDFIEVPDHPTRHKFLDMAHKLKGSYAPEKALTLNLDIAELDEDKIKAFNEWHKEQTKLPRK